VPTSTSNTRNRFVGHALIALRYIAAAIRPGGRIYILGQMLDDSRLSPTSAVNGNLAFLNAYDGGQAYTEGEYRQWLSEAGSRTSAETRHSGS
jgi:hypothetical protein